MMSPVPVLIFVRSMLFLYHVCSGYRVLSASAKYVKGKETMRMRPEPHKREKAAGEVEVLELQEKSKAERAFAERELMQAIME